MLFGLDLGRRCRAGRSRCFSHRGDIGLDILLFDCFSLDRSGDIVADRNGFRLFRFLLDLDDWLHLLLLFSLFLNLVGLWRGLLLFRFLRSTLLLIATQQRSE
jgi:hypothetical protein